MPVEGLLDEAPHYLQAWCGHLVLDGSRLLLVDLGLEQIAEMPCGSCWRLKAVMTISPKGDRMTKIPEAAVMSRRSVRL